MGKRQSAGFIYRLAALITIAVVIIAVAAACGKKEENDGLQQGGNAKEAASKKEGEGQDDLLNKFRATVKQAKEAADIVSFLNENMGKAGQANADIMIRELNAFYQTDLPRTQEQFYQPNVQEILLASEQPITAANAASFEDKAVRQLVVTKLSGGYRLEQAEGTIFPIVDYAMQQKFSAYLSDALKQYVALKAVESSKPAAKDAGLVISWDELAERAVMAETFVSDYPDSPERAEVLQLYTDSYLSMYIYGLNNTPIFDYDTYKLKPETKASYEKLQANHPNTVTAETVKRFLEVLAGTGGRVYENKEGMQTKIAAVQRFHERFQADARSQLESE
ncbi:hypothetical protein [Paenibacillus radicis (ex Gao et al. 2016)]|uniref:Lipoprotein n=1 Tax=Paenibacillus radicis (ex Gao et al. 2016) TaxID=1737354 RepID=A0A917HGE1_9BACL|nr:hypothetical protein [Paenibacillus radicis (ex Gao et al. 2016)]GGG77636.1 hypothetical protein GCM10010918_37980 [Paenibacillus radicis (ex Gao et al. 2016)]